MSNLRSVVARFAKRYALTVRESDVVALLVVGLDTVLKISDYLGISQNTVHNHFKNVFRRTGTNCKAGLLALILRQFAEHGARQAMVTRQVSVLLINGDPRSRKALNEALTLAGMQVQEAVSLCALPQSIAKFNFDAVVADVSSQDQCSDSNVVTEVHGRYGMNTVIMLTSSDNSVSAQHWLDRGASKVYFGPGAAKWLALHILEALAPDAFTLSRLRRVDAILPARINNSMDAELVNVGVGGAFVTLTPKLVKAEEFKRGEQFQLSFQVQGQPIEGRAEVAWTQETNRPLAPSGVGVRFHDIDAAQQQILETFVRTVKHASLIPCMP